MQLNSILWAVWEQGTGRLSCTRRNGEVVSDADERYCRYQALRYNSCPHWAPYRARAVPLVIAAACELFAVQPQDEAVQLLVRLLQSQPAVGMQTVRQIASHPDLVAIIETQVWPWLEEESPAAPALSRDGAVYREVAAQAQERIKNIRQAAADSQRRAQDSVQHVASAHYQSTRIRFMLAILQYARAGTLLPNWRDTLTFAEPYQPTHAMYSDGDELVLHELKNLDRARWEPHAGVGWRAALESWYDAMSDVYTQAEQMAENGRLRSRDRLAAMRANLTLQQGNSAHTERLAAIARDLQGSDASLTVGLRLQRAYLDAWYRAGLAAGGVEIDWVAWFRAQIEEVDDPEVRQSWLQQLDDPKVREELEFLPDYWH